MRSSGATSPFSSAMMRSRTNSKAVRFSFEMGSAGSEGIFSGSMGVPFFQARESRCGPVEAPVDPTYPISCPCETRVPWAIPLAYPLRWRYPVIRPPACLIFRVLPPPPPQPLKVTTPSATACTGVPFGAA